MYGFCYISYMSYSFKKFSDVHIYNTWRFIYLKNSTRDKHQDYKKIPTISFHHIYLYAINVYHELLWKKFRYLRLCSQVKRTIPLTAAKLKLKLHNSAHRKRNRRANIFCRGLKSLTLLLSKCDFFYFHSSEKTVNFLKYTFKTPN